jgi:hypothetical protein
LKYWVNGDETIEGWSGRVVASEYAVEFKVRAERALVVESHLLVVLVPLGFLVLFFFFLVFLLKVSRWWSGTPSREWKGSSNDFHILPCEFGWDLSTRNNALNRGRGGKERLVMKKTHFVVRDVVHKVLPEGAERDKT